MATLCEPPPPKFPTTVTTPLSIWVKSRTWIDNGVVKVATSKGAVIGMTRGLARELGRHWIRVNAVAPSAVMTDATKEFFGEKLDRAAEVIRDGQSLKRNLEVQDLAGTILWLASDASRFVTGQTIMVDGGTTFL